MSVFTEAKIRKLLKERSIGDGGLLQLDQQERLTPSARSYLNDHHIRVAQTPSNNQQTTAHHAKNRKVTRLEDSAVYPVLFRLTKLYPYFLRSQRELYTSFEQAKFDKLSKLLKVVEAMVAGHICDELHEYGLDLPEAAELKDYCEQRELDFTKLALGYTVTNWKLALYETYIEVANVRKDLSLIENGGNDPYIDKLIGLLHSIEISVRMLMEK